MNAPVSVIVPVYNVKKYLQKCLDSLLCQTLKDIEILVIDDGSWDGSEKICDEYAKRDDRIRVIHQTNQGLSAARNRGMELAKGEYILFADSDDFVHPDFCRIPYEKALEQKADVVIFHYLKNGSKIPVNQKAALLPGVVEKERAIRAGRLYMGNYVWNKIYHRQVLDGILFPEGKLFEDIATTYRILMQAKRIVCIPDELYYYHKRAGTISTNKSKHHFLERIKMMQQYSDGMAAFGFEKEAYDSAMSLKMMAVIRLGTKEKAVRQYADDLKRMTVIPEEWNGWKRRLLRALQKSTFAFECIRTIYRALVFLFRILKWLQALVSRKS